MGKALSILVVSYNTRELTLACLGSVYAQTAGLDFEVILVDNASEDGSAAAIKGAFPQVTVIESAENLGFARANNLAGRSASGEYLLLLNSDTVVLDHAINRILEFAEQHLDAGIVGGRTFFEDGSLNASSCHGRQTPWSLFCLGTGLAAVFRGSRWFDPESLGAWQRDTVAEVDAVSGCFLLIRRELWDKLGGFDESFFMYGEDMDLCLRAWKSGTKCMITPDARIIHHGGRSERVRSEKMLRLFQAKAQLIRKHWPRRSAWFGIRMLGLWCFTRMAGTSILVKVSGRYAESRAQWAEIWRGRRRLYQSL